MAKHIRRSSDDRKLTTLIQLAVLLVFLAGCSDETKFGAESNTALSSQTLQNFEPESTKIAPISSANEVDQIASTKNDCLKSLKELRDSLIDKNFRGLCIVGTVFMETGSKYEPVAGARVELFGRKDAVTHTSSTGAFAMLVHSNDSVTPSRGSSDAKQDESLVQLALSQNEFDSRWYFFITAKSDSSETTFNQALLLPDLIPGKSKSDFLTLRDLKLSPVSQIYGTVVDSLGTPQPGMRISLMNTPWWTTSAPDGSYSLNSVPFGAYTLELQKTQVERPVMVDSRRPVEIDIQLPRVSSAVKQGKPLAAPVDAKGAAQSDLVSKEEFDSSLDSETDTETEIHSQAAAQSEAESEPMNSSQRTIEESKNTQVKVENLTIVNSDSSVTNQYKKPDTSAVFQNVGAQQTELRTAASKVFVSEGAFSENLSLSFGALDSSLAPPSFLKKTDSAVYQLLPDGIKTSKPMRFTLKCSKESMVYTISLHTRDLTQNDSYIEQSLGSFPCINGSVQFSSMSTGYFSLAPEEHSAAKEVGLMGEDMQTKNSEVQLSIPAGALLKQSKISMNLISRDNEIAHSQAVAPAVVLTPHGTRFSEPVDVKIQCDSAHEGKKVTIMWKSSESPARRWLRHSHSVCQNGHIEFQTKHFSVYSAIAQTLPMAAPPSPNDPSREAIPEHKKVADAVTISHNLLNGPHSKSFGDQGHYLTKALINRGVKVYMGFDQVLTPQLRQTARKYFGATANNLRFLSAQEPESSVWTRDFMPQLVRKNGEFGYVHNDYYQFGGKISNTGKALADAQARTAFSEELSVWDFEGGNFMVNSNRVCFVSDHLLSQQPDEAHVRSEFGIKMDCQSLLIVPHLPLEGTRHIDLYMKYLTDDTILISDFDASRVKKVEQYVRTQGLSQGLSLKDASDLAQQYRDKYDKQKAFLDAIAWALENGNYSNLTPYWLGAPPASNPSLRFNVVRIENPLAISPDDINVRNGPGLYDTSYTNTLFIHTNLGNSAQFHAFVPEFTEYWNGDHLFGGKYWYTDAEMKNFNDNAKALFERFGFKVTMIPYDKVTSMNGSVHCTTREVKWDCPSGFAWDDDLGKCKVIVSPQKTACLPTSYYNPLIISTFYATNQCP